MHDSRHHVFIAAALWLAALWASAATPARGQVVTRLQPHQSESGVVTQTEMGLASRWTDSLGNDAAGDSSWVDQWISTAAPFSFEYAGRPSNELLPRWTVERSVDAAETQTHRGVSWTDPESGLRLTWHLRRFADYPAAEWVLVFKNTGEKDTAIIENVQAIDLRLKRSATDVNYLIHGLTGGRSKEDDFTPFSIPLPSHDQRRKRVALGGEYPSSDHHLPFFNVQTSEGRGVLVGVGWSGSWSANVRLHDESLQIEAGLAKSHFLLHPGEEVRSPRILVLLWEGARLHGHNMLRRLLHEHYVPPLLGEPQKPLVSVNVCFTHHGYGLFLHEATEATVQPLIAPFSDLGAELFVLDAGWYDGAPWNEWLGNWTPSKTKYPNGLKPIADQLAESGMLFGVWFASEVLSKYAPVIEQHPEWLRKNLDWWGLALRMEVPEARDWFLQSVDEIVENHGLGCYRQDGWARLENGPPDRVGITEAKHVTGLYQLWDSMKTNHPKLVMEGCAGGGRRIDLETLSRFHWHQKSDRWFNSESDQVGLCGANLYLPGGLINVPTEGTDDYRAWSSFAGQLLLGWHPLDGDFPMAQARRQVERYKRIRHLLSGDFYPLTPCALDNAWIGYQFHRPDLDEGFVLAFRRFTSQQTGFPVSSSLETSLRGLVPDGQYELRFEGQGTSKEASGHELADALRITLAETPSSELIIYKGKR